MPHCIVLCEARCGRKVTVPPGWYEKYFHPSGLRRKPYPDDLFFTCKECQNWFEISVEDISNKNEDEIEDGA